MQERQAEEEHQAGDGDDCGSEAAQETAETTASGQREELQPQDPPASLLQKEREHLLLRYQGQGECEYCSTETEKIFQKSFMINFISRL